MVTETKTKIEILRAEFLKWADDRRTDYILAESLPNLTEYGRGKLSGKSEGLQSAKINLDRLIKEHFGDDLG